MDTNLYEQRTRVQNQQTNTFLKGMDTDTSDMLLGSDQYRYAENIRIITNEDNNSGEVRLIEGNVNIPIYLNNEQLRDIGRIMAFDAIRDVIVLITKKGNTWSVYKINVNNLEGNAELIFGPCEETIWPDDWDNKEKVLTTVLRWEADKNIKLYIADATGKHPIMVLNIANKYETGDFDQVFAYQRTLLHPADIEIGSGSGSIISGKVQYVYRLYSKTGAATPLSIISKTLSLYKNEYSGYEAEKRSGRSVNISINVSNRGNLDYIQIYRISYQLSGQLPKVSLVKDEKITSSFVDTGTNVIEDVGISELLSMFTPFIYPKQIESKGDYLFAGNMKYSQDTVDADFSQFDTRSYNIGNVTEYETSGGQQAYRRVLNINDNGYVTDIRDIDSDDIPMHLAFIEPNPYEYNVNHWGTIKYYDGEQTKECNGYGKNISWRYIYQNLPELSPQNQTGINETINNKSTFRCGEVYRFGVKLYNQYGQASSVKWIADIMIPDKANMYDDDGTIKFRNVGIEFFKTPGSNWDGISGWEIVRCDRTLNDRKAITQGIIGFPLRELKLENEHFIYTNTMCNPGFMTKNPFFIEAYSPLGNLIYPKYADTDDTIIMFSSPEYCYQPDDIQNILTSYKNQLILSEVYSCVPRQKFNETIGNIGAGALVRSDQQYNENLAYYLAMNKFVFEDHVPNQNGQYYAYLINTPDYNSTSGVLVSDTTNGFDAGAKYFISYFKPDYNQFYTDTNNSTTLTDISFSESPKASDFAKQEMLTFNNNITSIDNLQFINWSTPTMLNMNSEVERIVKEYMDNIHDTPYYWYNIYPIGSGGKVILFKQEQKNITIDPLQQLHAPKITVANIIKPAIPYGGYNKTSIDNSSYISLGDYSDGNEIDVFSGDTKNHIFTYNALHNWYDSTYTHGLKMAVVYAIPVETDIDIQAQYGIQYGVDGFSDYRVQDTADAFEQYTQQKGSYLYNPAYNASPDIVSWTTQEQLESKQDQFDTRIHYSNVKTNNEDIDSWLQFQASNYIDVDTRYGEITDLKLFKDKLIFWQENATGVLAVNERVVLNDQNDTQVVLGTGGVLERYDYFSTIYGQKKYQHTVATSNNSLYWWDSNNKEILLYQQKYDVTPLSTVKSVKNYINSGEESDVPFMIYDNKYKELVSNVVSNEAIVYNEQVQAFTSIYKFAPMFGGTVNGDTILTSSNELYAHNIQYNNKAMLFGEDIHPMVSYVVNALPTYNKTYDIQTIGGRFYGGGFDDDLHERNKEDLEPLEFTYNTPLKQKAQVGGDRVENVEYDYRLTIPRNGETLTFDPSKQYGNRLRGKFMKCQIKSNSNNLDFALQYITTKFRMSWT